MSNISAALVKELRDRTGAGMMECKKALTESNGDIEVAIDNMRKSGQAKAAKKSGRTAAEGVVLSRVSADGKTGYVVELNCETDFVAKDSNFLALANKVADYVVTNSVSDLEAVKAQFEEERAQLVAKIGENMTIRRVAAISGDYVGGYNHGTKISTLVALTKADEEVAKKLGMHIASSGTEYVQPSDVPAEVVARERKVLIEIEEQKPDSQRKAPELQERILEGQLRKFVDQKCLVTQEFVMDPSKKVADFLKSEGVSVTSFLCLKAGEGIEKEEEDFAAEVAKITGAF